MPKDENKLLFLYLKVITAGILILCVDRVLGLLVDTTSLFIPLIIALFLSILLNPLIIFLEKYRVPHILAVFITMLIAVVVIFSLYATISQSVSIFLKGFSRYSAKIDSLGRGLVDLLGISPDVLSGELKILDDPQAAKLMEGVSISQLFYAILNSLTKFISQLILVFLFLLFILLGRGSMIDKISISFSKSTSQKFLSMYTNITNQTQKYLGVKTLISFVTSLIVMGILLLFGVDFVLVWGILTFLFNFIPNIGSFVATLFPSIFTLIQFDNPLMALWVAICLIGVQFIIGNIIEPKIMGGSVNLSTVVILFALLFWGFIWGIPGMFLSVPMTVILKIVFENIDGLKPVAILMSGKVKA